jgi:hypothetical protein
MLTNLGRAIDDELSGSATLAADRESNGQLAGKLYRSGLLILREGICLRFEFRFRSHVQFVRRSFEISHGGLPPLAVATGWALGS